jgi:hypothetical protein
VNVIELGGVVDYQTIDESATLDEAISHQHGTWTQRHWNGWRVIGYAHMVQDEDIDKGGKSGGRRSKGK